MAETPQSTREPIPGDVSGMIRASLEQLAPHWGWFIGLGVAMLVLGVLAAVHLFAATVASVVFIGMLMLLAGAAHLAQAWRVKGWRSFLLWTLSGLAYAVAGVLALYDPLAGAAVLTLVFGAFLIAAGALRLWIWSQHRAQGGWPWLAASGFITLLAGVLVASGWPANSVWVLGVLLAFDLLFQGLSVLMLGLALRRGVPEQA